MEKTLVTGFRPTGKLHIGHLVGVVDELVRLQDNYKCFIEIADYHAMTDRLDYSGFLDNTYEIVKDFLVSGIDPENSIVFIQSEVKEHSELNTILSMTTPLSILERNPTVKERVRNLEIKNISYGFLGYPVLQAADILIYKGEKVPVGEDQLPHLEVTRYIAKRFNGIFGYTFPEPEPVLSDYPNLPGIDGRKMSKSYNNYILPTESKEEIKSKVIKMFTDPKRPFRSDVGHPEDCPVFYYHKVFNKNKEDIERVKRCCKDASLGCIEDKEYLAKLLYEYYIPYNEKRRECTTDFISDVLNEGVRNAREITKRNIEEIKGKIGISRKRSAY